jgi:hypothetical protein
MAATSIEEKRYDDYSITRNHTSLDKKGSIGQCPQMFSRHNSLFVSRPTRPIAENWYRHRPASDHSSVIRGCGGIGYIGHCTSPTDAAEGSVATVQAGVA